MNKQIQTLIDFIQQNDNISAEEKSMLVKEVRKVSSDLEIAEFKLERTEKVKRTTAILLEETIEELEQKRKAVEAQNRDLEIESSLERVRTVAMGMRKPDDMLEVCRIISQQSESLGIKEIRNVQTAIIYEDKGTYLNYEYYAKHDKLLVTEVDYKNHELQSLFANQMLRGAEELFASALKGKEVQEWYDYQKTTNQFADSYLENAQSLNYYFYSLGPVALGISTYAPLSEEEIGLFKRFRNVFDLAYRRFLDIEKALAQAMEAKIEASLERVRAQALSMRKPDDLPGICEVLFTELTTLGFSEIRNAMINIHDDEKASFVNYDYSDEIGQSINHLDYNIHPLIEKQVKQVRSAPDAFSVTSFEKKDLEDWIAFRKKIGEKDDPRIENTDALYYYFYSIGTGSVGISTFSSISDDKLNVLKRFRNVFDFAYRRYTDVAQSEAQAREAQIELGLERVRARAMAMQNSSELADLVATLFKELIRLDFALTRCYIYIIDPDSLSLRAWTFNREIDELPESYYIKYLDLPYYKAMISAWKERNPSFVYELGGEEKKATERVLFNETEYIRLPEAVKKGMMAADRVFLSFSFNNFGGLQTGGPEPLSDENLDIFSRFGKVFDLTYTRFNDLKLAEAQAREAQIELALERVRARTMAMQKSEELSEAVYVLFQQFRDLGENPDQATIGIINEEEHLVEYWVTIYGNLMNKVFKFSIDEPHVTGKIYKAWKEHKKSMVIDLSGQALSEFMAYREAMGGAAINPNEKRRIISVAFFSKGLLNVQSNESRSQDSIQLLERFAKVFEQTYTRFLDLQKAEAQAREAQIEAALERVRSSSLAMHKSEELREVVSALFQKLQELEFGIERGAAIVMTFSPVSKDHTQWITDAAQTYSVPFFIPFTEHSIALDQINAREKGLMFYSKLYAKEEKNEYFKFLFQNTEYKQVPKDVQDLILNSQHFGISIAFEKHSAIAIPSMIGKLVSGNEINILKRFAKVFEQAYTRFLDLRKAEAQAKDAQIEAALERVRAKSMAMHNSRDVGNTVAAMFDELIKLGAENLRCGILIIDASKHMEVWTASSDENGEVDLLIGSIDMMIHPLLQGAHYAWKNKESTFTYVLEGQDLIEYYKAIIASPDYPFKITLESLPPKQINTEFFFPEGALFAFTTEPLSADLTQIFKKFAGVFSLTYRRFLDLQKAEANARESQIEAGLERVRSRTLAMQKSEELAETAAVVFRQLIGLGIAPNRLYIAIIKDKSGNIEFWITDEDGNKVSTQFTGNSNRNRSIQKMYEGWEAQKKSVIIDMQGKELADYIHYLGDELKVPFKQGPSQKRRVQTLAYFSKGFIGLASPDEQPVETTRLLERFAGVFNLTFTRFNDLKLAEAQAQQAHLDLIQLQTEKKRAEEALAELKSTQTQLIQSEKMASLGELTAGIAHEIQNPLNFVNNFSEVSNELLDEMKTELDRGDIQEAKAIASDVKLNLEKILHHGKRADAIVKGMLQHSRSSSGVKEPTNINALADEYLRLAYHGLRAKDKSFNATLNTEFDETIGRIEVVPQDIGRVILNLITNAFYAVDEKKKQQLEGYKPTVTVTTKKSGDKVLISVKDNGNGIPQKVLEKIFQPFFTTKPTGAGTGLGLSLAYDIVKAHGGELKVETKEGVQTEFIIILPAN